jgi:hypothetical protein
MRENEKSKANSVGFALVMVCGLETLRYRLSWQPVE